MAASQTPRWGDDVDDSDDENVPETIVSSAAGDNAPLVIPPTHKSRIDANGLQIITSYRAHPNQKQLLKTITKVKITQITVKEPKMIQVRNNWRKFGQAKLDEANGVATTVQSKDEILLEDPHADTDLQDEDPATAIAGNLNAFWAKQQRRQLERKYDVDGNVSEGNEDANPSGGWTQVGSANSTTAKYVPPSARMGAAGAGAGGAGVAGYKPERRDDLNTIRVTNLSENTSEADLQELFQRYGRISRVYLAKDKETMQSRGFAFVSFVNKDDAARAMDELQGFGYDHLILKLEWARPNAPKDPASAVTQFRSGYGKALAQDTKEKVSYASNLTK